MIRFCLQEMARYELVKLLQEAVFSSDGEFCSVKITNKGKLVFKKGIPFKYNSQARNQQTVSISGNYINTVERDYIENNLNQHHSGTGDNVAEYKNTNNIYNNQEFTQTIGDIQALLEKLEQTYNPNTTIGRMTVAAKAIEHIEQDSNLAKRVLSALEKGGAAWLQAKIINPSASFLVAALEDWQKNKQ